MEMVLSGSLGSRESVLLVSWALMHVGIFVPVSTHVKTGTPLYRYPQHQRKKQQDNRLDHSVSSC